jgi:hypothetical protein
MDYEIKPHVGVGPLHFGMTPAEVRKALQSEATPSKKSSSDIPADFFIQLGIFVDYRSPGICQAIEFAGPASPTFDGSPLLGRPYQEVEEWIKTIDSEVVLDDAGLRSHKCGFGLYASSARKDPELPVEGVIVFDTHYYDRAGIN